MAHLHCCALFNQLMREWLTLLGGRNEEGPLTTQPILERVLSSKQLCQQDPFSHSLGHSAEVLTVIKNEL